MRRRRTDHAHKTALALVREYDVIAHERLSIANMVRAPKPKPDPESPGVFLPNGAATKAGLPRSSRRIGPADRSPPELPGIDILATVVGGRTVHDLGVPT